jgi:hypothetical protein
VTASRLMARGWPRAWTWMARTASLVLRAHGGPYKRRRMSKRHGAGAADAGCRSWRRAIVRRPPRDLECPA